MTTAKTTYAAELGAIVLAGIRAHRSLVDLDSVSAEERSRLTQGSSDRNDAKGALRELLVIAESFGWPEQLATETREEFVVRRTAELYEVEERVKAARAALGAQ
jgi:hypothetical protein